MKLDKEQSFYQQMQEIKEAYTHMGKFHADDVFSFALLRIIQPNLHLNRVKEAPKDQEKSIVFDIGWGIYDHHQKDARVRENEVPYAAFGLLWEQAGTIFFSEKMANKFDEKFVQPLDLNDNTGEPNQICTLVGDFNPQWNQKKDPMEQFLKAVDFASEILVHKIEYMQANEEAKEIVRPYLEKAQNQILLLDQYVPWKKAVEGTDIEFVVFASDRGGYNALTVNEKKSREAKVDFCKEWYGKPAEELQKISQIKTFRFCHKSGFMIAADTKEDAILACMKSKEAQTWWDKMKKSIKRQKRKMFQKKTK